MLVKDFFVFKNDFVGQYNLVPGKQKGPPDRTETALSSDGCE